MEVEEQVVGGEVETGLDGAPETMSDMDILNMEDEPVVTEETPASGEEKPAGEEEKPAGEEEKPAGEEEKPAGEEEKPAEEAKADENLPPSVKALKEAIDKDPVLKERLDANPALRNRLYANERRGMELATYKDQFATLDIAKQARQDAEDLAEVETWYTSGVQNPQSFEQLLERMADASLRRDATGNPIEIDGVVQSTGNFEKFFKHQRSNYMWPQLIEHATSQGADDVAEAAEIIMDFLGERKGSNAAPTRGAESARDDRSQLPKDVQARLAKLDSLERQQGTQTEQSTQQYVQAVVTSVETDVRTMLEQRVKRYAPALSPAIQKRIIDDTFKEINGIAGKDKLYQRGWSSLLQRANGSDETKKQLVAQALNYARGVAGPVMQKLVREFGTEAIAAVEQKTQKLDEQKAKPNVKSAGGTQTPLRQGDLHSQVREGNKITRSLFGRDLNDKEIMDLEEELPKLRDLLKERTKS